MKEKIKGSNDLRTPRKQVMPLKAIHPQRYKKNSIHQSF
jgi:hypothetical protein